MITLNNAWIQKKIKMLDNGLYDSWEHIVKTYARYGIQMLEEPRRDRGDCRDYAFTFICLPQYTRCTSGISTVDLTRMMKHGKIPELVSTDTLEKGVMIAYFHKKYPDCYEHFGVCVAANHRIPLIESRWGEGGHLVRHSLRRIRHEYGDTAEFYRLVTQNALMR